MMELTERLLQTGIIPPELTSGEKIRVRHELDELASMGYDMDVISSLQNQLGTWKEVKEKGGWKVKGRGGPRGGRGRRGKGDNSMTFWANRGK